MEQPATEETYHEEGPSPETGRVANDEPADEANITSPQGVTPLDGTSEQQFTSFSAREQDESIKETTSPTMKEVSSEQKTELPPINALKTSGSITSSGPPPAMTVAAKSAVRPNIIQLPGSMLGKGPIVGPALHAPTPRIISPTYHGGSSSASSQLPYAMISPYGGAANGPQQQQQQQQQQGSVVAPAKMELNDAFAYLDRVKAEFADQPDVYNKFLQIMREFKANA